jgi:hypothetical protein
MGEKLKAMRDAWFFKPGTEKRVHVEHFASADGSEERWIIPCQNCGKNFTIRPEHGPTIGPDGALSTAQSMTCPLCKKWHVTMRGGVVQTS